MNLTEAINLAKQGRSVGWGTIINSTYNRKRFLASKYSDASLDKILHDSYVKALSSIKLLNNPSIFSSWLGIIIASISAIELQKQNNISFAGKGQYENETWYMDIVQENTGSIPENIQLSESEIKDISKKLIDALNPESRMCFIFHYIEGFSVKEVSRALRCSESDVISLLNTGVKKLKETCEELKKSNPKLAEFSNPLQLFTYIFEAEYSYVKNADVPNAIFNKIIEDTALIVAEQAIVAEEKRVEEELAAEEDDEEAKENKAGVSKKKMIVIIAIVIAMVAGLTIHFVNKGNSPSEPAESTDKPSESDTVPDTKPTIDITEEKPSEETSENTSEEPNQPVANQTPSVSQQTPQNNNNNNNNYNSNSNNNNYSNNNNNYNNNNNSSSNNTTANSPQTTAPTRPSTTKPSTTQPSTQAPATQPTQPSTEAPNITEPDFEIPDIE